MKDRQEKISADTMRGGYSYSVTDEELAHFASLAPIDRLKWVDDTRRFILMTESVETRRIREELRNGKL